MPADGDGGGSRKAREPDQTAPAATHAHAAAHRTGRFPIVGIGASAGGLEAFEEFFSHMPADSGMAFVLVPHLDPTHVSILPELLQRRTQMEVRHAEHGMRIRPNHVYVAPPNRDMAVSHGVLQLTDPAPRPAGRMSIDSFFRTLARDQRANAVGIILSGTGSDGSLGLRAIRAEGGLVLVQDPDSAKFDGMPSSARSVGVVDFVLPPEQMPSRLTEVTGRRPADAVEIQAPEVSDLRVELAEILAILRSHTGHDFSSYKQSTISRGIGRRMRVSRVADASEYTEYLRQTPEEAEALFKEVLIGVTSFFRDPGFFEYVRTNVAPELLRSRYSDAPLRAWVPGCASGEEAYSVAIVLSECAHELGCGPNIQVFGTDLDAHAIAVARAGTYPTGISEDVAPRRLERFFTKENDAYRVTREIRDLLVFAPQNLVSDPPFTKLDLICCRNVFIYLDSDLQNRLVSLFHYSLNPNGILLLGPAEGIGERGDMFSVVDRKWKVYRRRESASPGRLAVTFPIVPARHVAAGPPEGEATMTPEAPIGTRSIEGILLDDYVPPCAIVRENGDIVYIHGRTGKYLEPAPGDPRMNILTMARQGLKTKLAAAIRKAAAERREVKHQGLRVKTDGGTLSVDLAVKPIAEPGFRRGLIMVAFQDAVTEREPLGGASTGTDAPDERGVPAQEESKVDRDDLLTAIDELETSNEELQLAGEELQSANEELQSTNEELETAKEELQSLNEELTTVNAELESRIEELAKTNDDLRNFLDSAEPATIFLDTALRIRRFTPRATEIVNLIDSDVGRPIAHIVTNLKHDRLVEDAEAVLRTLQSSEIEAQSKDGRWYAMRILPYRTLLNVVEGVVVALTDVTERRLAADALGEARAFAESIVDAVRESLIVLDANLRVVSANRSFYTAFKTSREVTEGKVLYDLGNGEWDIPGLRELLERVLPEKAALDDFKVEHDFPEIGRRTMLLNARLMRPNTDAERLILLALEDITERNHA
jgi:two-component system CheB/CheR fusion protein